ncbi:MAG: CPBP family intramembrane metalloprotease [Dinoroseobacter sp.]|nr:CPBP family intramembrane metalloprotease [Dinoroseobacter sp.]
MLYPAHAAFFTPAKERSALWRLVLGIVIITSVFAATLGGFFGILVAIVGREAAPIWAANLQEPNTPVTTLAVLATFLGMAFATITGAFIAHRRGLASLIGQNGRVYGDFFRGAGIAMALLLMSLGWFLLRHDVVPNLPVTTWLIFLPLGLFGILVQTGAEELLFRGYLQQQLAARFSSPVAWMVLPAFLFGIAHFDPVNMGGSAYLMLIATFIFGLLAADLTAYTGSIAAAWGFHFANNCLALLAVSVPGSISGLSLYLTPFRFQDTEVLATMIGQDVAIMLIIWGLIRISLRRWQQ